jgi:hypothetical protein
MDYRFSYKDMMQTQFFFEFGHYQLMPGFGFAYGKHDRELSFIIDNNFKIREMNQLSPFIGIGLRGDWLGWGPIQVPRNLSHTT